MKPLLLHYYVTYRCNARCGFCGIWWDERLKGVGSPEIREVERNLRQAKVLGARFVDLTGGEPLLYEGLAEALSAAKRMGFWTSVTTNCLLYPERARELAGRVDLLHFSLDSMDRRTHDGLRGVPCYDRVMESIEIAKRLGERPDLLCTVTSEHLDGVEGMVRFAQRERLILILNPVFSYFGHHGVTQNVTEILPCTSVVVRGIGNGCLSSEGMEALAAFSRRPYVYLNRAFVALYRRGGNEPARPRCRVLDSTIVLSPDGKLLVPCFHHHVRRIPVNGSLAEAYYGREAEQIRARQGRYDFCEGCTITCYFDPSFHYRVDTLLGLSLWSKAKYGFDKYVRARF